MQSHNVSRGRQILTRFLALAEERLAHLTELYETGRWQRYFTEIELLDNVRDAKKAVATWTLLVSTEALPSNRPVDLSWLDSERPLPTRRLLGADVEHPHLSARFMEPAPGSESVASDLMPPTSTPIRIDIAAALPAPKPVAEPPKLPPWQNALDYALLEQRYPLLRKTG